MTRSISEAYVVIIKRTFNTRFVISRLTRVPLLKGLIEKAFFEGDDIMILPRDGTVRRTINMDMEVDPGEDLVVPSDIIRETVKRFKGGVIMNFCICRESDRCDDYPWELGCMFLGPGAERISPSLARQVGEEEALDHIDRCREAGLVHLIGRNKIDSLWLNTGPKEDLLTICNCCPCCCLWKMIPNLDNDLGRRITSMPGITVKVRDTCRGCGACTQGVCFVDAIAMTDGKVSIDQGRCRGCGRCVEACAHDAMEITVVGNPMAESLARLASLVSPRQ